MLNKRINYQECEKTKKKGGEILRKGKREKKENSRKLK